MLQIRKGVFETNSSSTHALILCTQEEYDKLVTHELFWDVEGDRLVDFAEAKCAFLDFLLEYHDLDEAVATRIVNGAHTEDEFISLLGTYEDSTITPLRRSMTHEERKFSNGDIIHALSYIIWE